MAGVNTPGEQRHTSRTQRSRKDKQTSRSSRKSLIDTQTKPNTPVTKDCARTPKVKYVTVPTPSVQNDSRKTASKPRKSVKTVNDIKREEPTESKKPVVTQATKRKNPTRDPCPVPRKRASPDFVKQPPVKTIHEKTKPNPRKSKKRTEEAVDEKPPIKKIKDKLLSERKPAIKKIKDKLVLEKKPTEKKPRGKQGKVTKKRPESVSVTDFQHTSAASIQDMLLLHENVGSQASCANADKQDWEDSSSGSESDWEEVQGTESKALSPKKSQLPSQPVEITLQGPDLMRKKRKKDKFDLEDWFRLQVNRFKKESQTNVHKVHLLCLLASGCHNNRLCQDQLLRAVAMSLVPMDIISTTTWDLPATVKFTRWFCGAFKLEKKTRKLNTTGALMKCLHTKQATSEEELVLVFVLMGRSLGIQLRFIHSMQPMTYKASDLKAKKKDSEGGSSATSGSMPVSQSSQDSISPTALQSKEDKVDSKSASAKKEKVGKNTGNKCSHPESSNSKPQGNTDSSKKKTLYKVPSKKKLSSKSGQGHSEVKGDSSRTKNKRPRQCASKIKSMADNSESDDGDTQDVQPDKQVPGKSLNDENRSDDDFEPQEVSFRSPSTTPRSRTSIGKVKVISSDSSEGDASHQVVNYWAEVLINGKWICIDVVSCKVNKPSEMEAGATQPINYVMAYDNDGYVKDVTRKYACNWMSHTRKLRVDEEWWKIALLPLHTRDGEVDAVEDAEIQAHLMQKPLPTVIGDYKSHPLYALRRHLLKFEALYPDTSVPLGFIRKEPVYARECVHTLHSRQNWLKEARLVRIGEKPYKLVKGRKTKKRMMTGDEEPVLELFGKWQTEDYIPPPAFEGKVPRNEYGNVELFKPSMLPGGTVHLKGLPGLNRVARKLGLDCVAAMTGWDAHCGYSHPVLDGWVVCVEHKDTLLVAWDEEQEIIAAREAEKREKRVQGNWIKLIKGILIKERLKVRYELEDEKSHQKKEKKAAKKRPTEKATDVEESWPQNRMSAEVLPGKSNKKHHFEVELL